MSVSRLLVDNRSDTLMKENGQPYTVSSSGLPDPLVVSTLQVNTVVDQSNTGPPYFPNGLVAESIISNGNIDVYNNSSVAVGDNITLSGSSGNASFGGVFVGTGNIVGRFVSSSGGSGSSVVPAAAAGAGATTLPALQGPQSGTFTLTTGTTPSSGNVAIITFLTAMPAAPAVVFSQGASTAASFKSDFFVTSVSTTGFSIWAATAPEATVTHIFHWWAIARNP